MKTASTLMILSLPIQWVALVTKLIQPQLGEHPTDRVDTGGMASLGAKGCKTEGYPSIH